VVRREVNAVKQKGASELLVKIRICEEALVGRRAGTLGPAEASTVRLEDPAQVKALLSLLNALEDLDDTQHVYANFDIPDALLAAHGGQ